MVRSRPTSPWPALRGGAVSLAAVAVVGGLLSAQEPAAGKDRVELTRTALEKWVEARRTIARTGRDWAEDRTRLQDGIALLERDVAALREKIAEASGSTAAADARKAELAAEVERLQAAGQAFAQAIEPLEQRTLALVRRLPVPLRERVQPLVQRIPVDAAQRAGLDASKLSQRFLSVLGVLQEIDKWNREVTLTSEVRELGDGSTAEVTVVYVGLGHGYYVDARGVAAGVGAATDQGFVWTPRNDAAAAIRAAIAMVKNEVPAAFVRLPARIQ